MLSLTLLIHLFEICKLVHNINWIDNNQNKIKQQGQFKKYSVDSIGPPYTKINVDVFKYLLQCN